MAYEHVRHERARSIKTMQVTLGMISVATLGAGLALQWFATQLGLTREVTDAAAFAMLMAAIAHAAALFLWDR